MKECTKRPIDKLSVGSMVGEKPSDAMRAIFRAVSYSNGAAGEFFGLIRQRVRLQIVHHLEFVLDIP